MRLPNRTFVFLHGLSLVLLLLVVSTVLPITSLTISTLMEMKVSSTNVDPVDTVVEAAAAGADAPPLGEFYVSFGILINPIPKNVVMSHEANLISVLAQALNISSDTISPSFITSLNEQLTYANYRIRLPKRSIKRNQIQVEQSRLEQCLHLPDADQRSPTRALSLYFLKERLAPPGTHHIIIIDRILAYYEGENDTNDYQSNIMEITMRFLSMPLSTLQDWSYGIRSTVARFLNLPLDSILIRKNINATQDDKDVRMHIILPISRRDNEVDIQAAKQQILEVLSDKPNPPSTFATSQGGYKTNFTKAIHEDLLKRNVISAQNTLFLIDVSVNPMHHEVIIGKDGHVHFIQQEMEFTYDEKYLYPETPTPSPNLGNAMHESRACPFPSCVHFVWNNTLLVPLFLSNLVSSTPLLTTSFDLYNGKGALLLPKRSMIWTFNSAFSNELLLTKTATAAPSSSSSSSLHQLNHIKNDVMFTLNDVQSNSSLMIYADVAMKQAGSTTVTSTLSGISEENAFRVSYALQRMDENEVFLYLDILPSESEELPTLSDSCLECSRRYQACDASLSCHPMLACLNQNHAFTDHVHAMKKAHVKSKLDVTGALSQCANAHPQAWSEFHDVIKCFVHRQCPLSYALDDTNQGGGMMGWMVHLKSKSSIQTFTIDASKEEFLVKIGVVVAGQLCQHALIIKKKASLATLEADLKEPLQKCLNHLTDEILVTMFTQEDSSLVTYEVDFKNYLGDVPLFKRVHAGTTWTSELKRVGQTYLESDALEMALASI